MTYRLTRFSIHQTAKVIALIYGIIALVIAPIFYIVSRVNPAAEAALPGWIMIAGPILYTALAYVFTALGLAIFNLIAGWLGGIEFTLTQGAQVQ